MGVASSSKCQSIKTAVSNGWSIIPVGLNKKPFFSWKEYQTRRPTTDKLREWYAMKPAAWAVITGEVSGLVIIDFDMPDGWDTMQALGIRPHVRTGSGGYHLYLQHPGFYVKTLNGKTKQELGRFLPGLDIRADGGFAVFCGRNSEGEYKWLRDMVPDPLTVIPEGLQLMLGLQEPQAQPERKREKSDVRSDGRIPSAYFLDRYLSRASTQGRNNCGLYLAIELADNGYSQGEAEAVLREFVSRCPATNVKGIAEPYTVEDAEKSVQWAYRRFGNG